MVFPYLQLQSEEEKIINLLLQTSVQLCDNLNKIKKEEMEKLLIWGYWEQLPCVGVCLPDGDAFLWSQLLLHWEPHSTSRAKRSLRPEQGWSSVRLVTGRT